MSPSDRLPKNATHPIDPVPSPPSAAQRQVTESSRHTARLLTDSTSANVTLPPTRLPPFTTVRVQIPEGWMGVLLRRMLSPPSPKLCLISQVAWEKNIMDGICLARDALRRILSSAGHKACFNSDCFRDEQKNPTWQHLACIGMLADAIEHEIPAELLRLGKRVPLDGLQSSLVNYLRSRQPQFSVEQARWIVESWSMSMGLTHFHHILPLAMLRPGKTPETAKNTVLCNSCVLGTAPSP